MSLQEFKDVLLTVTDEVYHLEAPKDAGSEYVIWQEAGGKSLYASDVRRETVRKIQVDLYTGKEFTETLDRILEALEEDDIAFAEPVTYFDPDTKKIRHVIGCEVV